MKTKEQIIDELGYNILEQINDNIWWCESKEYDKPPSRFYIKIFDDYICGGNYSVYIYERVKDITVPKQNPML